MAAAARMELTGGLIDTETLRALRSHWSEIQSDLIAEIDKGFGVYVPTARKINPDSMFGARVLRVAEDWSVDPYQLAEAAEVVWQEPPETETDHLTALELALFGDSGHATHALGLGKDGRPVRGKSR